MTLSGRVGEGIAVLLPEREREREREREGGSLQHSSPDSPALRSSAAVSTPPPSTPLPTAVNRRYPGSDRATCCRHTAVGIYSGHRATIAAVRAYWSSCGQEVLTLRLDKVKH